MRGLQCGMWNYNCLLLLLLIWHGLCLPGLFRLRIIPQNNKFFIHSVRSLGQATGTSQGLYLHMSLGYRKNTDITFLPSVRFELVIPVSERPEILRTLVCVVTVIGGTLSSSSSSVITGFLSLVLLLLNQWWTPSKFQVVALSLLRAMSLVSIFFRESSVCFPRIHFRFFFGLLVINCGPSDYWLVWRSISWYLLTYLLTPWCRKLFEKLIMTHLVKNILLSYGTRRFITVFTKARHWTQFALSISISLRSILMLSSHLRLGILSSFSPSGLPTKTL